ncbi:hypothetical protein HNI00_07450 [Thermoleptolyngbya oregonensis NK1-22]|uniref:Uncharacterized protein n=1 Tax=Thermoleptolyngbya oregonensis NK1-22 TaxID=2547457 RepID=A0AA96Y5I6_9CYAN|nr:hypothetical protein [Thermoleptolyngbya oregonensis]WOB43009.1 hypothetical protein HNI00_07450 [Thermoleptolyngbya oregonensis NK1-22]
MGKKRINQLLNQLKENQQAELRNAAAIYSVAQIAVDELEAIATTDLPKPERAIPAGIASRIAPATPAPALPAAVPTQLTQAELLQRYGSYNGCRSAAKALGIHFPKNPSWPQLIAAFSYIDTFRQLIHDYAQQQEIRNLSGVRFTVTLK